MPSAALVDELRIVARSGRFDADFYGRTYREAIPAGQSPLDHFLTIGHCDGLLASPHFDPIVYKCRHPVRGHPNPLVDCALRGDEAEYRDIAALFPGLDLDSLAVTIRYRAGLEAEWTQGAGTVAEHVSRPVTLPWGHDAYELRNPAPAAIVERIAANRPFSFVRLGHGYWDAVHAVRKVTGRLAGRARCRLLQHREIETAAIRLLARRYLSSGVNCIYTEGILREIEDDLRDGVGDANLWTAVSLKGIPTFDEGMRGFDAEDVRDRLAVLSRYFSPADTLYDATIWKRWALSGDLPKLAEAARHRSVVLVGPGKFQSLGTKWGLARFRHVVVARDFSQLIRHSILDRAEAEIAAAAAEAREAPIVLFHCGDALAYWLIRRLRRRCPPAFLIDLGQALDVWYWKPAVPWMRVYRDALLAANPFAEAVGGEPWLDAAEAPGTVARALFDAATAILRCDYLETGLLAPPPSRPVCRLDSGFRQWQGTGWSIQLPAALEPLTDSNDAPARSPLLLLEDGKVIGKGHDLHADILEKGAGRYSFWNGHLFFSTTDGSDPNRNGRSYSVNRIEDVEPDA